MSVQNFKLTSPEVAASEVKIPDYKNGTNPNDNAAPFETKRGTLKK